MSERALNRRNLPPLPSMAEVERDHIRRVLVAVNGNKSRAAVVLGLDRRTIYRKIREFKLRVLSFRDCEVGVRVAFRNPPDEREAGAPEVELGTIDMVNLHAFSTERIDRRPVRVRWDGGGELTWPALSILELATPELEAEFGRPGVDA